MNTTTDTKIPSRNEIPGAQGVIWLGLLISVLALIAALRIISLYHNDTALFFDEAQYWLWGKEPAFGYFSKPPLLGWIIGAGTQICGGDSEFCVRLPSSILHTFTAIFIYLSATRLFDRRTGFWAALIYATLPGISLSSTLISTDVPLLLFWSASFWALLWFFDRSNWSSAVVLGLFFGFGLMAKYAMAYFLLCAVLLAIFDTRTRQAVLSLKFFTAIAIAILILSPNLWWNIQHDFITASHTGDNIGWRGGLHFDRLAEFFGSQFGVFGPVLFGIFLVSLLRARSRQFDRRHKLLFFFSMPVLLLICTQALLSKAYANWAAVTYICATILVADVLCNLVPKFWRYFSTTLHLIIFVALSAAVTFSAPGILTLPDGREPFHRLHGWREIAREVENKLDSQEFGAVIATPRHLTAEMVYYLRERREKVYALPISGNPQDHYELTRAYSDRAAEPVLLVSQTAEITSLRDYFANVELLGASQISSGSIGKIWFYSLSGNKAARLNSYRLSGVEVE